MDAALVEPLVGGDERIEGKQEHSGEGKSVGETRAVCHSISKGARAPAAGRFRRGANCRRRRSTRRRSESSAPTRENEARLRGRRAHILGFVERFRRDVGALMTSGSPLTQSAVRPRQDGDQAINTRLPADPRRERPGGCTGPRQADPGLRPAEPPTAGRTRMRGTGNREPPG
jgi:hypothetical protein